jgi:prepilin-type N-terminal cleavage/methylation domain-containing protein
MQRILQAERKSACIESKSNTPPLMQKTFAAHSVWGISPRISTARAGFSLVELLVVLAIMSVITAMSLPIVNSIRDSQNVTLATNSVSTVLQRARAYAMAHNTYVWVGFYEEPANTAVPTNVAPPYQGVGQVVIGMAASVDGTQIYSDTSSGTLMTPSVAQIEKLIKVENVHCTDVGVPTGTGTPLTSRPSGAYGGGSAEQYGIDSDNNKVASQFLVLGGYTFYKTIRFSPSGDAAIGDSPSSLRRIGEIDLCPTHGGQINLNSPNVAAIQFSGIGGAIQTYRN